jgi:hypothetical protein
MATEVRLLNVCRTLKSSPISVAVDEFSSIATPPWSDAGTWTLDDKTTSGLFTSYGNAAQNTNYSILNTGVYTDQAISTETLREVTLSGVSLLAGGSVSILMDMAGSTPLPSGSIRVRVSNVINANGNQFHEMRLYKNENLIAVAGVGGGYQPFLPFIRVIIDKTKKIIVFVGAGPPTFVYQDVGYTPMGGRVGIGLSSGPSYKVSVASFTFAFTAAAVGSPVSSADLPERTLVASAGGKIYLELKTGNMALLPNATRTLASDRLLSSVNRLEKLYIADYGLRKHGLGTGATGSTGRLSDSYVGDWSALAVSPIDDRVEILSGSGVIIGVYAISSISGTELILGSNPGNNGSSITYRIVRSPKVFDSANITLTNVPIGAIGAPPGQYPLGCTIVAAWNDRILWSGDPLFAHVVYMSKQGDPDDYLYANETEGEAFAYDPARVAGASQIGDAITAIIPHSHDYCIFAGYRSISIQRGDPTIGGALDLISRDMGCVDKHAYCYTPEQVIIFLSGDGLYMLDARVASADIVPTSISRDRLPAELINLNTALFDVQLVFDVGNQGIHIFITRKLLGVVLHWWFDWKTKAFWPETYIAAHEPTAVAVHTLTGSSSPTVIFGCRDGYLRQATAANNLDDGNLIPSTALLGPFQAGSPKFHGIIHTIGLEFATQSGQVQVDVLPGDTPEKARKAPSAFSFMTGGDSFASPAQLCRVRCGACFIRISNYTSDAWAFEQGFLDREVVGLRRAD